MHEATPGECTLCDRSCRYFIQNDFFCRLVGPVAPTGKAIVHWIGCINAIKCVDREVSNVKLFQFRDSTFWYTPIKTVEVKLMKPKHGRFLSTIFPLINKSPQIQNNLRDKQLVPVNGLCVS